ncbi:TIR domain-containing adapter molecule 1-like isoform X1 [Numida meleagris]|uniref:TIR domain-containing adapter molecule 1-like isoform X1 n=1 Tax=Numida meleagris TaxID=8996 RepID=UPI000B3DE451|nr:TIR domain-containing adapter molecule 1-like isoform X1 [Numida meleagris]XP_021234664.1 TIR domain-containing adapter molecule 1-like isoform X1 [Numida meleagris]
MAQSAEVHPSFEDVFNILSQVPAEKLLSLKYKLKHLIFAPSSKLLQAMVLLTLGQEADARICLNALGDNLAALYIHQTKLSTAGVQKDSENSQHPQLDAGAMALLAQIYLLLANEKLCSNEAVVKAEQAANNASRDAQRDTLSAMSTVDSDSEFRTLRSDVSTGFLRMTSQNSTVRSSPMKIRNTSDPSGPQTLQSSGISDSFTNLLISQSPTAVFHTPTPSCESSRLCEESTSDAGQPDGDRQSHCWPETGRARSPSSHPRQDTNPQLLQLGKTLQISSCRPSLPVEIQLPTLGAVGQPVESNDISSTVIAEPQVPKENRDQKQKLSASLPYSRTTIDTGPACIPIEDSYIPASTPSSAPASTSVCSFHPQAYFSSTIPPPLQSIPYNVPFPLPLHSSPSPTGPPPFKTVEAALAPEPDGGNKKFFTFVVLHAWEDEHIACRVKDLLENMGVPNGATFCEDFLVAGHNQLTCFQDAMENSAFLILLLTKNFLCHQCMFQTNSALMESIQRPSKHNSVIPFVPKENPLERSQIPSMLSVLVALDENSPVFAKTVQNTFTPSKISERKAMWRQIQQVQEHKRKLELYQDHRQTLQNLGALTLGSLPQMSPSAMQLKQSSLEQLLEQLLPLPSSQQSHPPVSVSAATHPPPWAGHPTSAQLGPSPSQPLNLPSGQHYMTADPGGACPIIIQHARMVQIGNDNTMHVETAAPGPQDSEEESRENA